MADGKSMSQRFQEYRPSKTALFWSCAGCIVATTIVGFTWGAGLPAGPPGRWRRMRPSRDGPRWRQPFCVGQFMAAADVRPQRASLQETTSSWRQRRFVENGGWAVIAGQEYDGTAELCADKLMAMEPPPAQEASSSEAGSITQ